MLRSATPPSPLRAIAVIPSRFDAQRFPGKPLHPIGGVAMIVRVLRQALRATEVDRVLVATDDQRIADAVRCEGGEAVMTDPGLPSGTDRAYAAVRDLDVEVVINVQGDEPMMAPENIDRVARFLRENPSFPLATIAIPLEDPSRIADPNVVKVVKGDDGRALYFSRSPLPFRRREVPGLPTWKHLGLYGYRKEALRRWTSLPPHPLELAESLEQLRALAAGMNMAVLEGFGDSIGVDTLEDALHVERLLAAEHAANKTESRP